MKNIVTTKDYKKLANKAKKLRQDTFLAFIKKGEAHLGGSFSMIEILITLYEIIMKKEDKFIAIASHYFLFLLINLFLFFFCLSLNKLGLSL